MSAQLKTTAALANCTGERIAVRNPRSGAADYFFHAPSTEELAATAAALRRAQRDWLAAGLAYRIAVLQRWRDRKSVV